MVVPTPTTVITPALVIMAVPTAALVYVMAPADAELGGVVMVGAADPKVTVVLLKTGLLKVTVWAVTVRLTVEVLLA